MDLTTKEIAELGLKEKYGLYKAIIAEQPKLGGEREGIESRGFDLSLYLHSHYDVDEKNSTIGIGGRRWSLVEFYALLAEKEAKITATLIEASEEEEPISMKEGR